MALVLAADSILSLSALEGPDRAPQSHTVQGEAEKGSLQTGPASLPAGAPALPLVGAKRALTSKRLCFLGHLTLGHEGIMQHLASYIFTRCADGRKGHEISSFAEVTLQV